MKNYAGGKQMNEETMACVKEKEDLKLNIKKNKFIIKEYNGINSKNKLRILGLRVMQGIPYILVTGSIFGGFMLLRGGLPFKKNMKKSYTFSNVVYDENANELSSYTGSTLRVVTALDRDYITHISKWKPDGNEYKREVIKYFFYQNEIEDLPKFISNIKANVELMDSIFNEVSGSHKTEIVSHMPEINEDKFIIELNTISENYKEVPEAHWETFAVASSMAVLIVVGNRVVFSLRDYNRERESEKIESILKEITKQKEKIVSVKSELIEDKYRYKKLVRRR